MYIRRVLNSFCILFLLIIFGNVEFYPARYRIPPEGHHCDPQKLTEEKYDRVLDILFPRGTSAAVTFILRYEPNAAPESQIVITKGRDTIDVIEYKSLSGNIYRLLSDFVNQGGKDDENELAKLIKVERRSFEVSQAQFRQWHSSFLEIAPDSFSNFRKKSEEFDRGTLTVALDSTTYNIWYEQGLDKVSFSFVDQAAENPRLRGDFKLVQWMNDTRRQVERSK